MSIFSLIVFALLSGPSGEGLTLPAAVDSTEVLYRGERDGPRCEKYDETQYPPIDLHAMRSRTEAEACIFRWVGEVRDIDVVLEAMNTIYGGWLESHVSPPIDVLIDRTIRQSSIRNVAWTYDEFPFAWGKTFWDDLAIRFGGGPYSVGLSVGYLEDGSPRFVQNSNSHK